MSQSIDKKKVSTIGTFYFRIGNGGIEKVVALLIGKWKKMGYNVVLFTDEVESSDDYISSREVERIILPTDYSTPYSQRSQMLSEMLEKYSVDVFVYHAWGNPNMKYDRDLIQQRNIPFIVYTHGVFSTIYHDRNDYTPYFREEIKKCDMVLSLTKVSQRFYEILGCRSILIQNPIDPELLEKKQQTLTNQNIIWVSRLIPEKKPQDAIRIFSQVKKRLPKCKLTMVGKGPEEATCIKLAKELGLEKDVEFTGYQRDIDQYYTKSDILLYTSMYEGFCMVLLEAKAYGIPSVIYELPYLSMTEDPKGIVSVKQDDQDSAANEICAILSDNNLYKELSKEAYASLREMNMFEESDIWNRIFVEVFKERKEDESLDNQMLDLLLTHEEYGHSLITKRIHQSFTYRLGDRLLKIPKKINDLRFK